MGNIYNRRQGQAVEPGPLAKAIGANAAREYRRLTMQRQNASAIKALEDQAKDWRQRALDGRITGLDPEIRALYVRKAEQAEAEAKRLKGQDDNGADLARAARLELEAAEHDRKAVNVTDPGVREYHRDKAREARTLAALARGERVNP